MKANVADWKEVQLGTILRYLDERATIDDEKEYLTITVKRRHGGLEIREKLFGHQIATKKQFRLVPGSFIISRVQCWHQAYAIVGDVPLNAIASTNYDQFAILPEVDSGYFWWLSHSPAFTETVRSSAVGVVIEKMVFNREEWLAKSVRMPPLPEQQLVVARIEELAAHIHEARTLRQQGAEEAEALTRKTADALLANNRTPRKPLRELLSEPLMNGLSVPASRLGSGVCFAKVGVVNTGVFNPRETKLVDVNLPPDSRYWLKNGDIVVSRGNSPEFVGRAAVYRGEPAKCAMPDLLIRVRLDSKKADTRFVSAFFHSSEARDYIASQISGTSSTMPKISQPKLAEMHVPVPPLLEQRRIVSELDALQAEVDALKRLQAETAAELDAMLPAILDRAFKGEL